MNLAEMRAQPDAKGSNLSKANFFDWKEAGTMGSKVRPFGQWVRRYLHFVRVYKQNGEEITTVVPCINFDYDQAIVTPKSPDQAVCPIDEVYDLQIKGETSEVLPFIKFPEPPASWGKDAKIQRASFSANVNAINRAKQNGSGVTEECLQVVSFKKTAFEKILLLAGASDEADADFTRGDPASLEEGYDIKLIYHQEKPGTQRYEVQAGLSSTPLTDEENISIADAIDLQEYYKIRTRDEIIEHLNKIYESDGNNESSPSGASDDIANMMKKAESSLNVG